MSLKFNNHKYMAVKLLPKKTPSYSVHSKN